MLKPFTSYIGSKYKFKKEVQKYFPETFNNYYEPFVGGGSVLFHLDSLFPLRKCFINDLDSVIIQCYRDIKDNVDDLMSELDKLYQSKCKSTFNIVLNEFREHPTTAKYIYITKRSFNGNMKFSKDLICKSNYSANNRNKNLYDKDNLEQMSKFLKDKVSIHNTDYKTFLTENPPTTGDFVFLDPPYKVKNVKQYYKYQFDEYIKLKEICDELYEKGVRCMITLNYTDEFNELFKGYNIRNFKKHSWLSCGKGGETEMVITNY
jgi:DNA adenine methylase